MTTHRRAWALRAGVVLTLIAGTIGLAAPAHAADSLTVAVRQMTSTNLHPGDQATLTFRVQSTTSTSIDITVQSSSPDVTLKMPNSGNCGRTCSLSDSIEAGNRDYTVTVTASNNPTSVQPGGSANGTITIQVAPQNGSPAGTSKSFTLNGPAAQQSQAPTSVIQVSGVVRDKASGQPIPQATVRLLDGVQNSWEMGTNSRGQFTFKSTADKPIAPGILAIGADKDGYDQYTYNRNVSAGQSLTGIILSMASNATPSATATSAESAMPTQDGSGALAGDSAVASQGAAAAGNSGGGGGGGFSTILIVLGALLILLGVGAIVLILMRRKDDGTDPGDDGDGPGPHRSPMPVPPGRGPYRPAPVDQTMVAHANAETTLLRRTPPVDEYPDPYGAPLPPRPPRQEYPGPGGYGHGPASPYQEPTAPYQEPTAPYQAPASGPGYGGTYPTSGAYGGGYPEATQPMPGSGYRPQGPRPPAPPAPPSAPPADPYGASRGEYENRGGYGGPQGGDRPRPEDATGRYTNYDQVYDQPRGAEGGYGSAYSPTESYGGGTTEYGATSEYGGSRGGYGSGQEYQQPAPRGGYDSPGGYGGAPQGGYESPDEYPPTAPYDPRGGGYDEYGSGRSRHSAPQQPPNYSAPGQDQRPDERRSLDWLDD